MLTDITNNHFYVKKLISVGKSPEAYSRKTTHMKTRHCEALVYVLGGSAAYRFDDGMEFTIAEGDIMYMSGNAVYTVSFPTSQLQIIFCDFEFDGRAPRQSAVYKPKNPLLAKSLFEKLLNQYSGPSKTAFHESMALFYEIYGLICNSASQEYVAPTTRGRIAEIKAFIDTNFKDPDLSVRTLAEHAHMSEVYLRKLFRSQYDVSPSQYITSVRLKKSKELMRSPFLTLEACALQSGFSSLQYFCRVFKKETGMTPHSYRKKV